MRGRLIPIVAALIIGGLVQWLVDLPPHWPISPEAIGFAGLIGGVGAVAPGIIIGVIAGRHGSILAAIVGFSGRILIVAPIYVQNELAANGRAVALFHASLAAVGFGIVAATSGAAGQYIRSKFRLSGGAVNELPGRPS